MSNEKGTNQSPAVQRPAVTPKDLADFLKKHMSTIQAVAAKAINPERMVRIVIASATKSPLLIKCDPLTILRSCAKAAELGLEIEGGLGEAYLVPYWNTKRSCYEAQCIPGYRGLIKLARRSDEISKIEAHAVYENDGFDYEHGTEERLIHKPTLTDRGKPIAYYSLAVLKDGAKQFEVMSKDQIDAIRKRSKAGDSGPWVSDFDEMARKTTVRRLAKYLPMSIELADALQVQAQAEAGDFDADAIEHTPMPQSTDGSQPNGDKAGGSHDEPEVDKGKKPEGGKKISASLVKTLQNSLKTRKIPEAEFCMQFSVEKMEDLPEAKLEAATQWINQQQVQE